MKKLAIIGSKALAQQIAYYAKNDQHYHVAGFYDDFEEKGQTVGEYKILGTIEDIKNDFHRKKFDYLMIGIGYNHMEFRAKVFDDFVKSIPFGTIVHSSAYVDKSSTVGQGTFIYPGCIIDMNVQIGDNVLLNAGCTIAHDSKVGNNSFFGPRVAVAGFVNIADKVNLGISTTVIDNISINTGVKTGGATTVLKDIEIPGLYVGTPAVFKKELIWN